MTPLPSREQTAQNKERGSFRRLNAIITRAALLRP